MGERLKNKYDYLREREDVIEITFEEDFWKRIKDQNLESCLCITPEGFIQIRESILHIEDLAYYSTVGNFLVRLFSVLQKFEFDVMFLEVGLILPDHKFNEFDADDWNAKWNNCETAQFVFGSVEALSGAIGGRAQYAHILLSSDEKRLYHDTKHTFTRYGYEDDSTPVDENIPLVYFPLNRIRNFCFRVTARK